MAEEINTHTHPVGNFLIVKYPAPPGRGGYRTKLKKVLNEIFCKRRQGLQVKFCKKSLLFVKAVALFHSITYPLRKNLPTAIDYR